MAPRDAIKPGHTITGHIELRRVGARQFPVNQVVLGDTVLAETGRLGWLRIYMGRGTPVVLADGTNWRIRSATISGTVRPLVVDKARRRVAMGAGGHGIYGITGKGFGYALSPGHRPRRSDAVWSLRHHEVDVGEVRRHPLRLDAFEPIHLAAVLLSFVLMRYGVPDDHRIRMPQFRWG